MLHAKSIIFVMSVGHPESVLLMYEHKGQPTKEDAIKQDKHNSFRETLNGLESLVQLWYKNAVASFHCRRQKFLNSFSGMQIYDAVGGINCQKHNACCAERSDGSDLYHLFFQVDVGIFCLQKHAFIYFCNFIEHMKLLLTLNFCH